MRCRPMIVALSCAGLLLAIVCSQSAQAETPLTNVAFRKPATAGRSQGRNFPANALDGDLKTRWCNGDGRVGGWWCVDLGEPRELGGCEITWERDGLIYQCVVEGSIDNKTWFVLNDQRDSRQKSQVQKLMLSGEKARYLRITITGLPGGVWASFTEVKVFDVAGMKTLTTEERKAFAAPAPLPENLALDKPAIASSCEGDRVARYACDGNTGTRWCASDENRPQWWEVDLGAARDITEVEITWEQRKKAYRFVVEGSGDNREWKVVADRRQNMEAEQVMKLPAASKAIRYLRITVTGIDDTPEARSWVSIAEVKVLTGK